MRVERAAAAATPDTSRATPAQNTDVVIVGAGLSGLTTARRLLAHGIDCIVLEARDRVGGRTLNHDLGGGQAVEMGGQWVGPLSGTWAQSLILALAHEVGVGTFPTYSTGTSIDYRNGIRTTYSGQIPLDTPVGDAEVEKAVLLLDQMSKSVPAEAPWTSPSAAAWDGMTVETFRDQNILSKDGRQLFDLIVEGVYSAGAAEMSLLDFLFGIAATGTLENQYNTAGGAQDSRFIGGSQLISIRVAQQLGSRVVLNTPVRRIDWSGPGVDVVTDTFTVHARHVVVTAPPPMAARINYSPPLPGRRDGLCQAMPLGAVIKVNVVYDHPWWRDAGMSGYTTSDVDPIKTTFDNSPPSGKPGIIVAFFEGNNARLWGSRTPAERRAVVLQSLQLYLGAAAATPVDYVEKLWLEDPWGRCGYGGFFTPGGWLAYGPALIAPVGPIHWAGTETSTRWNGYMDGAVQSAERAVTEVVAAIAQGSPGAARPAGATTLPLPSTAAADASRTAEIAGAGAVITGVAAAAGRRRRPSDPRRASPPTAAAPPD